MHFVVPILAFLAVAGLLYVFVYPLISDDAKATKRKSALQTRSPVKAANRANDSAKRRKQVADSLKEIEARANNKKVSFETKMAQAGVSWSKQRFYIASLIVGLTVGGIGFFMSSSPLIAGGVAVTAGLGLPRWYLGYLRKRRIKKFIAEFPAAIDIIVRGIKAGIPLGDCLRSIAAESAEPVRTEFRSIVETQAMGLSIAEAVERLIERVPTSEANFFSIVINIQSKAGGNLAEALSNLSNVLRSRKMMKSKIAAMSSEAKASAGIIACLPPLVCTFVYFTSPNYIMLLFTTGTGHMVLGCCAGWMALGVFVMKKMINFDI